jgi:hypothetical protein
MKAIPKRKTINPVKNVLGTSPLQQGLVFFTSPANLILQQWQKHTERTITGTTAGLPLFCQKVTHE